MSPSSGSKTLLRWRKGANLSQKKVAERIGVGQSAVCEWEKGSRRPDFMNAMRLELLSGGVVKLEAWGLSREASLVTSAGPGDG